MKLQHSPGGEANVEVVTSWGPLQSANGCLALLLDSPFCADCACDPFHANKASVRGIGHTVFDGVQFYHGDCSTLEFLQC